MATKKTTKKTIDKERRKEDKRIQDLEEIIIGMGARMTILENLTERIRQRMGL